MDMPVLVPMPIETKSKSIFVRIWRWMTSIRNWKLYENWEYKLPNGTKIVIPKEFQFDGASIPRPLWALLSPVGLLLIQGLVHDFGYRYDYLWALDDEGEFSKYEEGAGKLFWDKVFREVGKDVNGMAIIDTIAWLMLVLLGGLPWYKNRKRNAEEIRPRLENSTDDKNEPLD